MLDLGIASITPIGSASLGITFRCECRILMSPCQYPHEDGPCGLWAIGPSALFCVKHHLIFNDERSLN